MNVMRILHAHNVMLNVVRQDLQKLHLKLDKLAHQHSKEVICVNAFQSVARQVTRRRRELEEDDIDFEAEVLVEK